MYPPVDVILATSLGKRVVYTLYSCLCQIYFLPRQVFPFFLLVSGEAVLKLGIISAALVHYLLPTYLIIIAKLGWVSRSRRQEKLGNINKSETGSQLIFDQLLTGV